MKVPTLHANGPKDFAMRGTKTFGGRINVPRLHPTVEERLPGSGELFARLEEAENFLVRLKAEFIYNHSTCFI